MDGHVLALLDLDLWVLGLLLPANNHALLVVQDGGRRQEMLLAKAVLFAVVFAHLDLFVILERLAQWTLYSSLSSLDLSHAYDGGRWTFGALEFFALARPHGVVGFGDHDSLSQVVRIPLDDRPQFFDLDLVI